MASIDKVAEDILAKREVRRVSLRRDIEYYVKWKGRQDTEGALEIESSL